MTEHTRDRSRRNILTRKVMKTIAHTFAADELAYSDSEGRHPLVVALPYENMSVVAARVATIGGNANVAIAFAKHFQTFVLTAADRGVTSAVDAMEINQDLSAGMFVHRLGSIKADAVRLRFNDVNSCSTPARKTLEYA